jgi:PAS domain S-box-containing protein
MKGLSGPQGSGAWRFLCLAAIGALLLCAFVAVLASDLPLSSRRVVSDLGLLTGGVVGAVTCGRRRRGFQGRRRRAWSLFAGAGAATALGNLYIFVVHVTGKPDFWTVYSAPAFLVALLAGMLGLSQYAVSARRRTDLARLVCDCVIVSGALFIITVTFFPQVLTNQSSRSIALLLPMLDVVVATYAILIFLRVGPSDRLVLGFLSGGTALYAAFDLSFIVLTSTRPEFGYGSPLDAGWAAGYVLIALAALLPAACRQPTTDSPKELSPIVGTVTMYALVSLAAVLSLLWSSATVRSLSLLWLLMVLAVGARQLLLIVDNDRLRFGLEQMVTDRTLELETAIRRTELLLTSVGEGIYGVDRSGLVTFVNPAGARTLGQAAAELIGKSAHDTFHAPQDDGTPYPEDRCYVTEAISEGTVTNAEADVYSRADGTTFPVEVTATQLSSGGYVGGAVVAFRDITQRLEVDRMKSEFVSMVSHELRTPLTSIRGSLGLLAGGAVGPLPHGALRMVSLALDSSARLTRLINDMLDIERIESGTMPMVIGEHSAGAMIEAATAQLQVLAAQVDVRLLVTASAGSVHADADRVVQTLINLLDNAIKFSPPGSTVEVASVVSGDFVDFRISDEGRGIPPEKLDSIFSRFEQVDSSDARDKGGSGLGLAISRSVIERLGGEIWAESVLGVGSTFRFTLPRSSSDSDSWTPVSTDISHAVPEPQHHPSRVVSGLT